MKAFNRAWLLLALLIVAACASPAPTGTRPPDSSGSSQQPSAPKRIVAAMKTVPKALYQALNPANVSGGPEACDLVGVGLTAINDRGERVPVLAEAVPSTENGLWTVAADGTMETTWRIREGAAWHDGAPFTAEDLVFTLLVVQDRDLAVFRDRTLDLVDSARAPDARTVTVRWKQPFINADALFADTALPLPKHVLEKPYTDDKPGFLELPYWSQEFVGNGPFKLKEMVSGSHMVLQAFEKFAPGRPKVNEVEVRFVTDDNTLISNLLAGSVDFTLGRGASLDQAIQVREQWRDGHAEFKSLDIFLVLYPQFQNPTPPLVQNPQFRRALLHAIDRQQLVDTIQSGLVPVADSIISPNLPIYKQIESNIVRYQHDPQRSAQLIEGLGYTKAGDGIFRDAAGQRLSVGIQVTTVLDIQPKTAFPVSDDWQRAGVGVDMDVVPPQRGQDLEYRANFPSFALQRQPANLRPLPNLHSIQARTAERGYTGNNNARYMNPEMDALIDRYLSAIPIAERTQVVGQMIHRMTDELIWIPLFFDTEPSLIANRLINVNGRGDESKHTWNAKDWDVKS